MIKAIETSYRGYRFRSRLEARWAVFFDTLGVMWEYETEGYDLGDLGWYLPDFWFPEWGCFGEVKPTQLTEDEWNKCNALPYDCLILDGMPEHRLYALTGGVGSFDKPDTDFAWYTQNNVWGRVCIDMSAYKGRLWYSFGEEAESYDSPDDAIHAARSARFEHGETPR